MEFFSGIQVLIMVSIATLALFLWIQLFGMVFGIKIFNSTNNMFGNLNASGENTSYILSLGKFDTLNECQQAFNDYYNKHINDILIPRSFIYYTSEFDPSYRHYCYDHSTFLLKRKQ